MPSRLVFIPPPQAVVVDYVPVNAGIEKVPDPSKNELDGVFVLRAAHEIAESIGGHEKFFDKLGRIMDGVKEGGVAIMAEPQYSHSFADQPEIIKSVKDLKKREIGHSHDPEDYIPYYKMREKMESYGFELVEESEVEDKSSLEYLNLQYIGRKKSPCFFYIQTYRKKPETIEES